jgi:hypothetical protein
MEAVPRASTCDARSLVVASWDATPLAKIPKSATSDSACEGWCSVTPFFARYGDNSWAAVQQYQKAQVDYAAAPVIKKYLGVLAAADVYTASTTFVILESIRLDLGAGSQVHA